MTIENLQQGPSGDFFCTLIEPVKKSFAGHPSSFASFVVCVWQSICPMPKFLPQKIIRWSKAFSATVQTARIVVLLRLALHVTLYTISPLPLTTLLFCKTLGKPLSLQFQICSAVKLFLLRLL